MVCTCVCSCANPHEPIMMRRDYYNNHKRDGERGENARESPAGDALQRGKVLGGVGRGTGRPNPNIMVGDTIWFFVLNNISSGASPRIIFYLSRHLVTAPCPQHSRAQERAPGVYIRYI